MEGRTKGQDKMNTESIEKTLARKHIELEKKKAEYITLETAYQRQEGVIEEQKETIEKNNEKIERLEADLQKFEEIYDICGLKGDERNPIALKRYIQKLQLEKENLFALIIKKILEWISSLRSKK